MRPAPLYAYTQKFEEVFPYYLSIGMTYEQFWEQDCELVKFYRKAAKINRDLRNQDMWLQGLYFYEALCKASPAFRSLGASKPEPYRSEPLDLYASDKERKKAKEQASDNKAKAMMEAFAIEHNRKFKEKGGGVNG